MKNIRERHILVDVGAFTSGSLLVNAINQRSWLSFVLSVVVGLGTYLWDRMNIRDEEDQAGEKRS